MYDSIHLEKCVRNNLLDKDLELDYHPMKKECERKFASWQHIIDVYEIDIHGLQDGRFLPKLTDRHIYPNKINKMRAKNALQVFILRVAGRLDALAGANGIVFYNQNYSCTFVSNVREMREKRQL